MTTMLSRHTDGVIYLTTDTVADLYGVDKSTVSLWRTRGLLPVAHRAPNGWPLYSLTDAAVAEKLSRDRGARRKNFLQQLRQEIIEGTVEWPAKIKEEGTDHV
jgi:DNA-binding transcriptional MerR regulator